MYGFNYEDLEKDYACFNFGLRAQFLSYDYRLFQQYRNHINDGTVVFIPVSYFVLFGGEDTERYSFEARNKRYYSILSASLIKEYDLQTDLFVRYLPALATSTGDLIQTLLGRSINTRSDRWQKDATGMDVSEDAKKSFDQHIASAYSEDGSIQYNQEEIDALYALIKGCQEKGAIPILITTPYLREYTDEIKENAGDFYDSFYSIMDEVVRDTGVEFYDYAFDERFIDNYSWFMNSDHLNQEGARNFVNILMNEIVYAKGYY